MELLQMTLTYQKPVVHKFSKNLDATWKFFIPEGWQTVRAVFYILHFVDRASCNDTWQMTNVTHKFLSMYLTLFLTLYMFRTHHAHHQERQIVSIQPLVAVSGHVMCRLGVNSQPAHDTAANTEW